LYIRAKAYYQVQSAKVYKFNSEMWCITRLPEVNSSDNVFAAMLSMRMQSAEPLPFANAIRIIMAYISETN